MAIQDAHLSDLKHTLEVWRDSLISQRLPLEASIFARKPLRKINPFLYEMQQSQICCILPFKVRRDTDYNVSLLFYIVMDIMPSTCICYNQRYTILYCTIVYQQGCKSRSQP